MNKDVKIVIDAGHGGNDSGAVGNGMLEKDYTLLIAKYLKNRFDELGVNSFLIRSTDETVSPTERVNRVLNSFGNRSDVIVLSNHLNAGGGEGSEVIYALRNNDTLASKILENLGKEGLKMRKVYQRTLPNDKTKDYYFIHRNTGITEPVLIEYGFIDNPSDAKKIMENYEKYAEAVVKAVSDYVGIPYEKVNNGTYKVQKGDTLWNIAKKNNITVDELKRLNNLNSNLLYIGQELILPNNEVVIEEGNVYEVQKGDTLYSIAKKYNTTVDKLKEVNSIVGDLLTIGTTLLIPNSLPDIIIHKVIKGDSLWALSKKYNTTVDLIKELNNLVSDLIKPGDELKIKRNTI